MNNSINSVLIKSGITLLIIIIAISCETAADKSLHNPLIQKIKINVEDKELKIKDIIDSVSCNFFYADSNIVIGEVNKIIPYNEHYYVLDRKQFGIIIFDKSGRFELLFSKKGFGPGEYNDISDFTIFKNMICILDVDKIFMYSMKGKYLKTIHLTFTATKFENIENNFFSFFRHSNTIRAKNKNFNLIITNENGRILRKYFPYTERDAKNNITTQNGFYVSNNEVSYIHRFNDTIYSLNNGYLKPKYYIDFGKKKMPANPLEKNRYLNYPHFIKDFSENQDHIIFSFTYLDNVYHAIYDKKSQKSICYKALTSDDHFLFMGAAPFISTEKGFYSVFEPYEHAILFFKLMENNPEGAERMIANYPRFEEFFAYIEGNQINPVLVFQKYKMINKEKR